MTSPAAHSAPTTGDREADWIDLEFRIQTAATRLEHHAIRVQEFTHISEEEKTDEVNRLAAKRSGLLLCLDYMRGYPRGDFALLSDVLDGVPDRRWVESEVGQRLGVDPDSLDIDNCRIYPPLKGES
jgi:hypothetical protein